MKIQIDRFFNSTACRALLTVGVLLLTLGAIHCGGGGGEKGSETGPYITSFTASPNTITAGATTTLTAVFGRGSGEIYNGKTYLQVQSGVPVQVTPGVSTTYQLSVSTLVTGQSTTASLRVKVLPNATITVDAPHLPDISDGIPYMASVPDQPGATFRWTITGGTLTYSNDNWVNFTGTLGNPVHLACSVTSPDGENAQSGVDLKVAPTPSSVIQPGWLQAPYATIGLSGYTCSIPLPQGVYLVSTSTYGITKDAPMSGGTLTFTPTTDTPWITFVLTNDAQYQVTATLNIKGVGAPTISTFALSSPFMTRGTTATLNYSYFGGIGVIQPLGLTLPDKYGLLTVNPASDQAYTLTVTNLAGTGIQAEAPLQVVDPPTIQSFTSDKSRTGPRDTAHLTPYFTGGTGIVDPGGIMVSSGQSLAVSPIVPTRYRLSVTNQAGTKTQARLVVHADGNLASSTTTNSALVVDGQGRVWAWGGNASGQLGNANGAPSTVPVMITGLSSVLSVVSGRYSFDDSDKAFCAALRSDGTVWTWGSNRDGQLGDNSTVWARDIPQQVPGLSNITQIAAGSSHLAALDASGTVWTWGANNNGQLGTGDQVGRSTPMAVGGLPKVELIGCSKDVTAVIGADGTDWMWGHQDFSYSFYLAPFRYLSIPETTFSVADGLTWMNQSWPTFYWYQPSSTFQGVLVLPQDMAGYASLPGGPPIMVRTGGLVYTDPSAGATPLPGVDSVVRLSEARGGRRFVDASGRLLASGDPGWGLTGNTGPLATCVPTKVQGIGPVDQVVVGFGCGAAHGLDGSLWGWGWLHQSATFAMDRSGIPLQMPGSLTGKIVGFDQAAFNQPALMFHGAGGWGDWVGGPNINSVLPMPGMLGGTTPADSANGGKHLLIAGQDGTLWVCGAYTSGQLGLGTSVLGTALGYQSLTKVPDLSGVKAVAGGALHSIALLSDGTLVSFGRNAEGQLGLGTAGPLQASPVVVPGIYGAKGVVAGGNQSLVVLQDGTVWIWGEGTGAVPIQIQGLPAITALAAGERHVMALASDGTVWTWGDNHEGQLGLGDWAGRTAPIQVPGLSGITRLFAAGNMSMAIDGTGALWAWGCDSPDGQLGLGRIFPQAGIGEIQTGFRLW